MLLDNSFGNKYESFLVLKSRTVVKKETAAATTTNQHGFGKRLWSKTSELQSAFGVQIYGNLTAW